MSVLKFGHANVGISMSVSGVDIPKDQCCMSSVTPASPLQMLDKFEFCSMHWRSDAHVQCPSWCKLSCDKCICLTTGTDNSDIVVLSDFSSFSESHCL